MNNKFNRLKHTFKHRGIMLLLMLCVIHLVALGISICSEGMDQWAAMAVLLTAVTVLLLLIPLDLSKNMEIFLFALIPSYALAAMETFTHSILEIDFPAAFLNLIFYYLLYWLLFLLTGKSKAAVVTGTLFFALTGATNYFVLAFRSIPILPWDLNSIGTAATVAHSFTFSIDSHFHCACAVLLLISAVGANLHLTVRRLSIRLLGTAISVAALIFFIYSIQLPAVAKYFSIYEEPFTQGYTYRKDGFFVAFFQNMKYLKINVPENYSAENASCIISDALKENPDGDYNVSDHDKPNIIVIMDEAFSDLQSIHNFKTTEDSMPFFHSLMTESSENTQSGQLYVSVVGGNTANTEFEFLTGDSMAFLPVGSVPYQQYLKSETPGLTSLLKEQGYTAIAMHPYFASGWNRNTVYPYLGFDASYFYEDFEPAEYIREYISDQTAFQKIIDVYEANKDNGPLFTFLVTMQNHGGYSKSYEDFLPDIFVSDHPEWGWTSTYLSLLKQTDDALQELISYFERQEERTIILMFGDHQPTHLDSDFWQAVYGKSLDSLSFSESISRYHVPFVLWANYNIEEKHEINTIANYLGNLLLDTAGIETTDYMKYLRTIQKEVPIVTANFYAAKDGTFYPINEQNPLSDLLKQYAIIQYNHLFDKDERLDPIFH